MVPEHLGGHLGGLPREFEDYSDKTPSIIPRKSDEIGESRKGVAVYFPPGVYIPLTIASWWCSWGDRGLMLASSHVLPTHPVRGGELLGNY